MDSTGKNITITNRAFNLDLSVPSRLTVDSYLIQKYKNEEKRQWKKSIIQNMELGTERSKSGRGITFQTPKIKSKAFQRITGGETLSLNVTGDITIDGSMRNEKRSQKNLTLDRAPNTNFQMKQTQRFQVEGKIGNNISIRVDQDSERDFDFENAVKLDYTGNEDGIVQKIEAGNVALSLPATRFVTYSAQSSGLFGLKSQFKIGALDITAIASMEKAQKKKLALTGGKEESSQKVQDYDFKRFTYFFVNDYFRNQYMILDLESGLHSYTKDSSIVEIEVYKSDAMYESREGAFRAIALANLQNTDTTIAQEQQVYKGFFIRLEPNTDYVFHKELGYIIMNYPLQEESEVLAISFKNSYHRYGELIGASKDTVKNPIFKLIKPRKPRPSDQTWKLEWKNVYSIGGRNLNSGDFDLSSFRIYYKTSSGDPRQSWDYHGQKPKRAFLDIFGLDKKNTSGDTKPDDIIDNNPDIINWSRGEIIFPDIRPFDPDITTDFPSEFRSRAIYDTTLQDVIRKESKFYLEFKSSSKNANYSLGAYVVDGSEEVLWNGTPLVRGTDYILDTFSGNLTILKQEALTPSSSLEIRYESQQLFSVDKKSLMGMRAEYALNQNSASKSFIGATLLYFNQKTMDQRIRIGTEGGPYHNLVWDLNTALNFQPKFLTRALNALPIVEASAPSSIAFEGEIAQVIPNPNTINNKSTGDNDGVAYMDDFEGSKRQIPLSISRNGWVASSAPTTNTNAVSFLAKKGQFIWFNPYLQTHINEIWPNREVTTNYGGTNATDVLTLALKPNSTLPPDSLTSSWGGITMDLSSGYSNQTESRFLEIWVKGDRGTLHFDLGQVSEDIIPNGMLNTEDKYRSGIKNMMLDEDEDTGLDGMFGSDPPSPFAEHQAASVDWTSSEPTGTPYDFYDLNRNGKKEETEPWSYDNFRWDQFNNTDINGMEDNQKDGITRYPNTEDINGNSSLDTNDDYYEFSFSLDKTSEDTLLIGGQGGASKGKIWTLYRIPLNKPSKVMGQPDWSRVEFIRLWMDGLTSGDSCSIAEISLTGNEWKYQGTSMSDSSDYTISNDSTMTISVVNTHENPGYTPPPGVSGIIDPIQKIESREQSLELTLYNLRSGESAVVEKQFYNAESIINYRNLKMFVHGGNYESTMTGQDSIELFLRWGSDTQNEDYYEVRLPIYPGWDERNHIFVSFDDLSRLKVLKEVNGKKSISETIENGHIVSVVGEPSLTNVRWLILGIRNKHSSTSFSGGVWIDELRVSNVQKEKGMAMRARADMKFSDVFSVNGEFTKQDADFHTVNDRFGGGMNSFSGSANSSVQISKFLPGSWAVLIPVTVNYSKSVSTPKYLPNSDILIDKNTMPDSLIKKNQSISSQQGINVSFSRTVKSRNLFLRYLLDPMRSSANYSKTEMSDSRIRLSQNKNYSGSFGYSLNFGGQSYIQPFKWLGDNKIIKKISQSKFYYLPNTLNLDVRANQSNREQHTREGISSVDNTAGYSRSLNFTYKPVSLLSMDYSRSYASDMRNDSWYSVFSTLAPGDTTSMEQNFSTNVDPKLFSFFNPSLRFSSNYRWSNNLQMKAQGTNRSANVGTSLSLNGNFDPARMIQSFGKKSKPSGTRPSQIQDREEKKDVSGTGKKGGGFSVISIIRRTGSLFGKIEPISVSITQKDDRSDNGIVNGEPTFLYQFGFPNESNLGFDYSKNVTSNAVVKRNDLSLSFRTGLKITSQIRLNFDYGFSNSENLSNVRTGSISKSVYSLKDNLVPFPSWSFSWGGLEKLPFISKYMRVISLSHNFSGKQSITWNDDRDKVTQDQITKDFRPFAQVSFTFKNGITGNVQYTKTESFSQRVSYGSGKTKNTNSSLSISANYSKTGGIRLPFFKKHSMQNTLDFSLAFESSNNVQFQSSQNDIQFNDDNVVSATKNWSFKPNLKYRFSNTVTGGSYFEFGKRSDKRIGDTSVKAFGINAAISLSGQ